MNKKYKAILLSATFVFVSISAFLIFFNYFDRKAIQDVSSDDLEYFSVLMFYDENVELVNINSIEKFAKEHPNYSFLVSEDKEFALKQKFNEKYPAAYATFTVDRISENEQNFHIRATNDGETAFWYEARKNQVFPKKVKSYGAGFVFSPCILGIFVAIAATLLLNIGLQLLKKPKTKIR